MVVKLAEWADAQGVSRQTAYAWFRTGRLPVPARRAGRLILVDPPSAAPARDVVAVYAQAADGADESNLDRQVARLTQWATGRGLPVDRVAVESGATARGGRDTLLALLADPGVSTIVVADRGGRLGRAGDLLDAALAAHGRRILVADVAEGGDGG